jgi:hypothetical protein
MEDQEKGFEENLNESMEFTDSSTEERENGINGAAELERG